MKQEIEEAYEVKIAGRKEPLGFDREGDAKAFCREMRRMGANCSWRMVE